jgi:hypothetical protein
MKLVALVAVPPGLDTRIRPVVAPLGTVAVIRVALFTVKDAATLLNVTEVAPVKFDPLILTDVPTRPLVGLNEVIVGPPELVTLKLLELVAVPWGVVTRIRPSVAPFGTCAVMRLALLTLNDAATLLNVTEVAPVKFDPLIVTEVPTGPLVGLNEVIVGPPEPPPELVTLKLLELVAVPSELWTRMGPSLPLLGTVAVIVVSLTTENAAAS